MKTVEMLSSMKPGRLPKEIFDQVAKLTVTPVVEIVPFYKSSAGYKVLTLQRSEDDPLWPGKYHVPGTVVSALDDTGVLSSPLKRLLDRLFEYHPGNPELVEALLCSTLRGTELAVIYSVVLKEKPLTNLFSVESLPPDLIEGHRAFIEAAYAAISRSN